ncbi:MAG: PH domain-containing protein [Fimbriimonas sp.]
MQETAEDKVALVHEAPQSLHPAIRNVWRWSAALSWAIFAVIFSGFEYLFFRSVLDRQQWIPFIAILLCFGFAGLSWLLADKQYKVWTYQLRKHDLVMSHGLLWKSRRCIARGRVQHIDINSGPLDRHWGLVQVSIYVAGALGSVGSIPGLTPEQAEKLREAILEGRATNA